MSRIYNRKKKEKKFQNFPKLYVQKIDKIFVRNLYFKKLKIKIKTTKLTTDKTKRPKRQPDTFNIIINV
jgi:hypothetical protein